MEGARSLKRPRTLAGLIFFGCVAAVASAGCARPWIKQHDRPLCVVLSAGGPAGLAHIGALAALRDDALPVGCISGTSMGALIGGLYATAPEAELAARYQALLDRYEAKSRETGTRNAIIGALLGGLLAGIAASGEPNAILGGLGLGAAVGANVTPRIELERFVSVLDDFVNSARIETNPLPYVTFYQEKRGTKLELVVARQGKFSEAIGKSIANPFIFSGFDPVAKGYVDPGADRVAATPIEDTCKAFPRARILAINVTGQPSHTSKDMRCPLVEVFIDAASTPNEAMRGRGSAFDAVVALGYERTRAALAAERQR